MISFVIDFPTSIFIMSFFNFVAFFSIFINQSGKRSEREGLALQFASLVNVGASERLTSYGL